MTSLGKSEFERHIFGAVSIAVSAFIAFFPTLILWAWRERRFAFVGLGLPVFLAFVAFSLSSAVGFAAKSLVTARLAEVRRDLEESEAGRKALGAPRPVAVVQEALRGFEHDHKWRRSKECQNVLNEAERSFCKAYADLKVEAARANELASIEKKIETLKSQARGYEERGGGREADNQAAVLATLLGWRPVMVERGLTLYLAVLVEIGAAFGLYFATGHLRNDSGLRGPSRGGTIVEARVLKDISQPKTEAAPLKQIAGPASGPRRVPRMKRKQNSNKTEAGE
jgi:hypothetical protein